MSIYEDADAELVTMHLRVVAFGQKEIVRAEAAAAFAHSIGVISEVQYRDYVNRINYCPGHGDREWCGYCSNTRTAPRGGRGSV